MIHTENLTFGIITAATGILTVMAVLLIMALILSVFELLSKKNEKTADTQPAAKKVKLPAKKTEPAAVLPEQTDDTELIAVIAAAVAASMNTSVDKIVVRSIRKTSHWKNNTIDRLNKTQ